MRRPHPAVTNHHLEEAVINYVETPVSAAGVPQMVHADITGGTDRCGWHGDGDVGGNSWRQRPRVGHPPEHDRAEGSIVGSDEITFSRARIKVVNSARRL